MADRRAFRPGISESLEDRLVPSGAAAPVPTVLSGPSRLSPPPLQLGAVLGDAFRGFMGSYAEALKTVLLAAGDNGRVDPAANRLVFNACVGVGLTVLAATLARSLNKVLGESSLLARVRDAIVGDGPESLESRLLALPTCAIIPPAGDQTLAQDSLWEIRRTYIAIARRVLARQGIDTLSLGIDDYPRIVWSSDSARSGLSQVVEEVRAGFSIFLREYFRAVQHVLLRTGPNGPRDAAVRRPEFDSAVSAALESLDVRLGDALNGANSDPASATLTAGASATIVGEGPDSLRTQLALLPTPARCSPPMIREFTLDTFRIVASVLALVTGDLAHVLAPSRESG